MKIFLRILIGLVVIVVLVAAGIFGMRFYNSEKWGWNTEEEMAPHDLDAYPETFENGTVDHFERGMANGFHLLPDDPVSAETVVVFGGSEGSSNFELAMMLAEEGYEVYSLFFFGADNQTEALNRVPIEFFDDFLEHAELTNEEVTVIGGSKGAELGLVLTNYYDEINNLVLYTPSSYVFMGLDYSGDVGSSWTYEEEELPYIDITQSNLGAFIRTMFDMIVLNPVKYRETYESAVEMNENSGEAKIDTSNFDGHALLLAGTDDAMWQGDVAAEEISEEIGDNAEAVIYEDAGHLFGGPVAVGGIMLGGNEEANVDAKEDSDLRVLEFLEEFATE